MLVQWNGLTTNQAVTILWTFYWVVVIITGGRLTIGREEEEDPVIEKYGTHPDVARCEVFRGSKPNYEEKKEIYKKRHDPLSKDVDRTRGYVLFFVALVVSILVGNLLISWALDFSTFAFPPLSDLVLFVPVIVSFVTFEALFYYAARITYEYVDLPSDM